MDIKQIAKYVNGGFWKKTTISLGASLIAQLVKNPPAIVLESTKK